MYNSALSAYVRAGFGNRKGGGALGADRAGIRSPRLRLQSRLNEISGLYIPECLALGHPGKGTAASLSTLGGVVSEPLSDQWEQEMLNRVVGWRHRGWGGSCACACVCGGVGVCLCGIRQWLGCMTRATRKFPVWWSSSPAQSGRQQSWPASSQAWETFSACLVSMSTVSEDSHWEEESGKMRIKQI